MKLETNEIFKTYGITPHQYHGGYFVGNNVQILMADAKEICADIAVLFKSCEERIVLTDEQEAMSDADIDKIMRLFGETIVIANSIFSICNRPDGYLTDTELDDTEETI